MKDGLKPEHGEAINMVENEIEDNDLSRLERFKKLAKENMVGLSALAISIAGLITTVGVCARNATKQGAKASAKFAKALANLAKNLGALLGALLNIIAQSISWDVKGLAWLTSNQWVLAIAEALFIYDRNVRRK